MRSINGFESFKLINKNNLNQEVVIKFMIMEKLFPRSLKYCVNKLLEVHKFLPKSPSIKNNISKLLKNFSSESFYIKDRKMLKLLDDFQFGLINLDKAKVRAEKRLKQLVAGSDGLMTLDGDSLRIDDSKLRYGEPYLEYNVGTPFLEYNT